MSSLPPCDKSGEFETRRKKILVAEDNDSNYALLLHMLKDYDLMRAENGVEAVDAVRNGNFDFVLMDLKMPIMGGLEATRKIREFDTPDYCADGQCFRFRPSECHGSRM